jgi:sec-independent protein translocase protein TatA
VPALREPVLVRALRAGMDDPARSQRRRTGMIGDLFDSPWKILIVAVVLIVLFGSKKLPDAARSLGKSMRILKTEVSSMHEDEPELPRARSDQPS